MIWLAGGLVYLVITTLAGIALGRHLRRIGATYTPTRPAFYIDAECHCVAGGSCPTDCICSCHDNPPQASRPPRAPAGPTSGAAQGGPALRAAPDPNRPGQEAGS